MMSRTEYTVEEGIGILMMNDPARLNPLDIAMDDELLERLEACEADPAVQVVVLGGKGRAFSAGAICSSSANRSTGAAMRSWMRFSPM